MGKFMNTRGSCKTHSEPHSMPNSIQNVAIPSGAGNYTAKVSEKEIDGPLKWSMQGFDLC